MLPGVHQAALEAEMRHRAQQNSENLEEYAQRQGVVVVFPTLRERITLGIAQTLITLGHKLKSSTRQQACSPSKEMA